VGFPLPSLTQNKYERKAGKSFKKKAAIDAALYY
jgi:hypothetical protein